MILIDEIVMTVNIASKYVSLITTTTKLYAIPSLNFCHAIIIRFSTHSNSKCTTPTIEIPKIHSATFSTLSLSVLQHPIIDSFPVSNTSPISLFVVVFSLIQ